MHQSFVTMAPNPQGIAGTSKSLIEALFPYNNFWTLEIFVFASVQSFPGADTLLTELLGPVFKIWSKITQPWNIGDLQHHTDMLS